MPDSLFPPKNSRLEPESGNFEETVPSPSEADCNPPQPFKSPVAWVPAGEVNLTLQPPYLAMFIADSYAALGEKDSGLRVLNNWIKYYEKYVTDPPTAPTWLFDRAWLEYGIVQELDEPFPTTTPEAFYLKKMVTRFGDWKVATGKLIWRTTATRVAVRNIRQRRNRPIELDPIRGTTGH